MVTKEEVDHLVALINGLPGGRQKLAEVEDQGGRPTIYREGFSITLPVNSDKLVLVSMAEGLRPLAIPRDGQVDENITSYWLRHLAASR